MMIEFYNDESVAMPRLHKSIVRAWIKQVAELHGKTVGNLCYQFCDDERILIASFFSTTTTRISLLSMKLSATA